MVTVHAAFLTANEDFREMKHIPNSYVPFLLPLRFLLLFCLLSPAFLLVDDTSLPITIL